MCRSRFSAVLLRLVLVAGALLAGLDLHVLEASAPQGAYEAPDGQVQLHCGGCTQHEHLPTAHDKHGCTACKTGATRVAGLLPETVVRPLAARTATLVDTGSHVELATHALGTLGARGPPGIKG